MKIVLATGIYPPEIGGPATYVRALAHELRKKGEDVAIMTYGEKTGDDDGVIRISKSGGPLLRWRRFAKALKEHGQDADVIECFSSVSCGIPLKLSGLTRRLPLGSARGKPKLLLRLGGDFAWERYTDLGRRRTLRDFHAKHPILGASVTKILKVFDHIVFSTQFQERLYEKSFRHLPPHSVIENALPEEVPLLHEKHDPLKLLFFGRFVKFKNLDRLLHAVAGIPHVSLSLVGEGPVAASLLSLARTLQLGGRVTIAPPVHGEDAKRMFDDHDLLVIPSLTEISPNAALEARAAGLPVLLTEENGLSDALRDGMILRPLLTSTDITKAILEADHHYEGSAKAAASPFAQERGWEKVAGEHLELFQSLITQDS